MRRRPKAYLVLVAKVEAKIKFESTSKSRRRMSWAKLTPIAHMNKVCEVHICMER